MRKIIIAISCCIVLLLLGFTGYRGYQVWKESHLLSLATIFAERADSRNELLCLQQVLRVNPRNLEACRRMAALAEAQRSPDALVWRERVVDLAPDSVQDRLALAQTALLMRDFNVATNALAAVSSAGQNTFAYQNLAGAVATALNDTEAAEKFFAEASRLEPENPMPLLSLSVLRLRGSNALDMASARIDLQRISQNSTNSSLRIQAKRELLVDALKFKEMTGAVVLAADLAKEPDASFSDKLLRLDVLRESKSPDYGSALAGYQSEAVTNDAKVSEMASWLLVRSKPEIALKWLQSLPAEAQTNQNTRFMFAQCQAFAQNWTGLQSQIGEQDWASYDYLRHAILALALRQQKLNGTSAAEWALAVRQAGYDKSKLIGLFELAYKWNWKEEAEQILWTIVERYPEEKWAYDTLQHDLTVGGRTRSLLQLFTIQSKRKPDDLDAKNNLAMAALLLDAQELKPYDLAQTVYEASSQNPAYASTYALALYLQQKYADALKVMQHLTPEQLSSPANAGYYGLTLKATGDTAKAKSYLALALKSNLMPEERKLFEQAMN